jgi:opacity protein-like surface antigen
MPVKSALLGASALIALSSPAFAADMEPASTGGLFGYLSGSYFFEDAVRDWRLFDTGNEIDGFTKTGKESFGDGYGIQGRLGYRWSEWDIAVGGQYADFSKGDESDDPSPGSPQTGTLKADIWSLDAQVGYNSMWGETALRTALGVRYAEWDHDVESEFDGRRAKHDFWGVGPRVEVDVDTPLSESLSLLLDGGVGVLFGKIKTDGDKLWACGACSDDDVTSLNVDARLGLGWTISPSVKLVAGYQVQYWNDVNVGVSDASDGSDGGGKNEGTSDHLIHGPFGMVTFDLSQ